MWRGSALRLERRFLTYTRLGPSASVSGRLRVSAKRCKCYRRFLVNLPQKCSIAVYTNAIDASAALLLAVVMLGAPVAGAGRSRCPIGPTRSHGVQPGVPVHLICLCTRPSRALLYCSTSNVCTRDNLSVVSSIGCCCFCGVLQCAWL